MSDGILQGLAQGFDFAGEFGIVRFAIILLVLVGYWQGLRRTAATGRARAAAWLTVAVPLVAWFLLIWQLAVAGAFQPRASAVPLLPLAIVAPVAIGLFLLTRSDRIASVLDVVPPEWLVGLQVYRVFGAAILVQWALGHLSAKFALPAGIGDVLVGALALPVALYLRSHPVRGRVMAIAWNILGVADLALAVMLGFAAQTARLRGMADGLPPNPISYPLVMIPAFAVPLSLILHGVSIWQLRRLNRRTLSASRPKGLTPELIPSAAARPD